VVLGTEERLAQWQTEARLANLRDANAVARLPKEEVKTWRQLWNDAADLLHDARSRFTETQVQGELTAQDKSKVHQHKLVAGCTYVIGLESTAFDTFLKLQDADGALIDENDDISADNRNSRLIFTAPADGVYRIVATSFQQAGTGPYTLRIREFVAVKP
jgi:hypothetical protein